MATKTFRSLLPALMILLIVILACNLPSVSNATPPPATEAQQPAFSPAATEPSTLIPYTPTIEIKHNITPGDAGAGKLVYDVSSEDTAPEKRAPYGDSYDIN